MLPAMNKLKRYMYNMALLGLTVCFFQCSGTRTVAINTMRPADISVDPKIQSLVLVDRTEFDQGAVNILEGILTGEFPEEDKAATQALLVALQSQLGASNRFTTRIARERMDGNSLTTAFPEKLSWGEVRVLMSNYNADAVVAVEIFDTDFIVTEGKRKATRTIEENGEEREVEVDEFYANGVDNLKIGIRFYDPVNRRIIDEELFRRTGTWEASAFSKAEAIAKLISKTDASRNISQALGSDYAFRIAPMPVRLTRSFKGKSKKAPALEQGARYADVGDWTEAARIWENGLNSSPTKEAGYMAYNIAIAHEVLGNLDKAIKWAQRSYTQYGNKVGRSYVTLLNNKKRDEELVDKQMN